MGANPSRLTVEAIRQGLEQVLRGGLRPAWLVHCPEMLKLVAEASGLDEDVYGQAILLEDALRTAIHRLGNGAYGRAAAVLLGADPLTRGLLLKDRRRLAASELDVLPSTFRKSYEESILDDVAVEIWRDLRRPEL